MFVVSIIVRHITMHYLSMHIEIGDILAVLLALVHRSDGYLTLRERESKAISFIFYLYSYFYLQDAAISNGVNNHSRSSLFYSLFPFKGGWVVINLVMHSFLSFLFVYIVFCFFLFFSSSSVRCSL